MSSGDQRFVTFFLLYLSGSLHVVEGFISFLGVAIEAVAPPCWGADRKLNSTPKVEFYVRSFFFCVCFCVFWFEGQKCYSQEIKVGVHRISFAISRPIIFLKSSWHIVLKRFT